MSDGEEKVKKKKKVRRPRAFGKKTRGRRARARLSSLPPCGPRVRDFAAPQVHPGLIEADKEECAIVVHYETSEPPSLERTPHTRRLRLKTLTSRASRRCPT